MCVCVCACACACARVCALGRCSRLMTSSYVSFSQNNLIRVIRDSNKKHRLKKKIEGSNNSYATVDIPVYEYNVLFLFIAF